MMENPDSGLLISIFDLDHATSSGNQVDAAKTSVKVFGVFFLVLMSDQNNGAIVKRSPDGELPEHFPHSSCIGNVSVAQISLNRVHNKQFCIKICNRSPDSIVTERNPIHFFIQESYISAICACCIQPRLDRISGTVFGALVDHVHRLL